jgi:hypothetical protein
MRRCTDACGCRGFANGSAVQALSAPAARFLPRSNPPSPGETLTAVRHQEASIEASIIRVHTPNGDETPSPAGMDLAAFSLRHIPTGGLTVVSPAATLVGEAVAHIKALPILGINAADDALVDRLLNKARTKTWRPIAPRK